MIREQGSKLVKQSKEALEQVSSYVRVHLGLAVEAFRGAVALLTMVVAIVVLVMRSIAHCWSGVLVNLPADGLSREGRLIGAC
jgi:hypothetical protein